MHVCCEQAAAPSAGSLRSQPQRVLAIPQESLASNQGRSRGHARPPAGPGQQASGRTNSQQQQPRTSIPRPSADLQQSAAVQTPSQVCVFCRLRSDTLHAHHATKLPYSRPPDWSALLMHHSAGSCLYRHTCIQGAALPGNRVITTLQYHSQL